MSIVNVIMRERKPEDSGPRYVTICMKGHWSSDGTMVTSGTWDATKFDADDSDIELFLNHLNSNKDSECKYFIAPIDECHLATERNEYWSDKHVHCNFKDNHMWKGVKLGD